MQAPRARRRSPGLGALAVLLVTCAFLLASAPAAADASEDSVRAAEVRLRELEQRIRRRSTVRFALDAVEAAAAALDALTPPPRPELVPVEADASAAAAEAAALENQRRLKRWTRSVEAFERRKDALLAQWVRLLGRLLTIDARHPPDALDFDLGIKGPALELLAATERPDAAVAVQRAILAWWRSDTQWVGARFHVAAFEALPRFRSPDVLAWLLKTFVGREDEYQHFGLVLPGPGGGEEELVVDLPLLALHAIARHHELPGRRRLAAVRTLVTTYRRMEERGARGGIRGRLWERVGRAARDATWSLAGKPLNALAAVPPTMAQLSDWLRAHGSPNDPAWTD